jgi:preprotein translocase subunit YajC
VSNWVDFLPLVLIVIVFYLLVLRPARNRQKEFVATQQALTAGTRVMLASGIFGELAAVRDDEVDLTVAPNVTVTVARQAVARVVTEPESPVFGEEVGD